MPFFSEIYRKSYLQDNFGRSKILKTYFPKHYFRFLPGLHGARRTGASQPMQKQQGTRDEGNTTHKLHARRVVCRCRLFLPLAVSISFHQQLSPRRRLPSSSSTSQRMWLRNNAAALIVDKITATTSQRLVVMPEACRGG